MTPWKDVASDSNSEDSYSKNPSAVFKYRYESHLESKFFTHLQLNDFGIHTTCIFLVKQRQEMEVQTTNIQTTSPFTQQVSGRQIYRVPMWLYGRRSASHPQNSQEKQFKPKQWSIAFVGVNENSWKYLTIPFGLINLSWWVVKRAQKKLSLIKCWWKIS